MPDAALRACPAAPAAAPVAVRARAGRCAPVLALLAALPAAAADGLPVGALEQAAAMAAELARSDARTPLPPQARVVALPAAPDARLRLAPCREVQAQPSPGAPAWGRTRVLLRCASGPATWRISLPVHVQVWAPAWVAAEPHAAGDTLAEGRLRPGVVDWAAAPTPPLPLSGNPAGRTLARPLAAGEPLREADLRSRQWFGAGDTVQVTARGSGFAIRAEAQALTPGYEGRPARLKAGNGRIFSATPVAEREAEVLL
jgi:flagella basal body P-ring formation protein FlgA